MDKKKRISIICGHYGCGKTNLALNMALEYMQGINTGTESTFKRVILLDMDIVNPYFRSSEYGTLLSQYGVRLISPVFSGTTLDTPSLPPDVYSIFADELTKVFIDVGGDDVGITALGSIKDQLTVAGYQMIYVINRYRVLSQKPGEAVALLSEIEETSGLHAMGIVNNSHLGVETTLDIVMESIPFAEETASLCGLPIMYHTVPDFALVHGEEVSEKMKVVRRYVTFPWEAGRIDTF